MAKRLEDLEVWQLADDLRKYVIAITETGDVARDFKFRSHIRETADSVCENTAEGFGRYKHKAFAQFLVIAHGSLKEVRSKLIGGMHRGYFSSAQRQQGDAKAERTRRAMMGLLRYLRSSEAPDFFDDGSADN
jgi:four helix bundle protein